MITEVEEYFQNGCGRCERFATVNCSARRWQTGLTALRQICLDCGLIETVKWGQPCYQHAGRNIALMGALRDDFRISFFDAVLLNDPQGILEKPGPNTQHACLIRFTDDLQVRQMQPGISDFLSQAKAIAEAGTRPARTSPELELPVELTEAFLADAVLAAAFAALTPGRQRSYVINLSAAKKTETRVARISRFRAGILAGKGLHER